MRISPGPQEPQGQPASRSALGPLHPPPHCMPSYPGQHLPDALSNPSLARLLTMDAIFLEFSHASFPSAKKPPICPLCLRVAGLSRPGQSDRDMVPSPSHLPPLTHSDSSSGTKLLHRWGNRGSEREGRTVGSSRAPGLPALLRPPLPCWTGHQSPWMDFLAFSALKSRKRHLGNL